MDNFNSPFSTEFITVKRLVAIEKLALIQDIGRSSGGAQQDKDVALFLQQLRLLLRHGFHPWLGVEG